MNTKRDNTSGRYSMSKSLRRRIGPTLLTLLAALALAIAVPARAGTQPAAIPITEIGAKATANYQGDALGVTAVADGARLHCGFQKLEGHATPEGLWLESTKPGAAGRLRLVAVAVGRAEALAGSVESACAGGTSENSPAFQRWDQCGQAPSREATAGLAPRFSRPSETSSAMRPNPALKRWAIVKSPSGTELPGTGKVSVTDNLVRFTRPGLTEEYSVSVDGVRQDFIIESPPLNPQPLGSPKRSDGGSTLNHSAGALRVELALSGARAEAAASGARLRLEGSGRTLAYSRLQVVDATGRQLTARLEVLSADRLAVSVADANATYPVRIDPTFSDADWVSLNPGMPGANTHVLAIVVDSIGNVYAGGEFNFIGTVPANHIAKWNGSAWSALGSGLGGSVRALAVIGTNLYAGGIFSTAGGVPVANVAKWNGSAWSALGSGVNGYVNALAVSGTNLYAGGYFTTAGGVTANNIAKWNGSVWSALGSGFGGVVYALAVLAPNLYAGGQFGIAKWDGSVWSALGSGVRGSYASVYALAVSGTTLCAAGDFTTAGGVTATNIAKWDGSAWSALGSGISGGSVYALAVSGTDLYAGGSFNTEEGGTVNYVSKWDGSAWSDMGSGLLDVFALAVCGTDLYAGGWFAGGWRLGVTGAGWVAADYIAKWDGRAWSALGSGMNNEVNALALVGTDLYAGGWFTTAGGATVNFITKWDGGAWSALGSGMDNWVLALAVMGTNLYAGGSFTTAGGVLANGIAKWDGSAWSALGSGIIGQVNALAVIGTNLYAGGVFGTAGGVPANCIAKWDGSAWSALGSGIVGSYPYVYALTVIGTNLYVGGMFTTAGDVTANGIAKWDGSAWSALGSGLGSFSPSYPYVNALAVIGTNVYAGGFFDTAGGALADGIAKWDGSAWSALGSGVGLYVYALAASGTDLYAGGSFSFGAAGGVPARCIAKWDGNTWSALGSGMAGNGGFVYALAADGALHLFVGGQFSLAGTNVSPFIAEAILGSAPTVLSSPRTQTGEAGGTVDLVVNATGDPPPAYQWYLNGTNLLGCTSCNLVLTDILLSESGTYTVVVTNMYGTVTSAPVMLNVIAPVARRSVPGVKLIAPVGTFWGLDYRDDLGTTANWETLAVMSLTNASQFYFDLSALLPPQRFYRAWQSGTLSMRPSLDLHQVPAITLTGSIGHSVRVDYINQFGPTDAWVTLDTVTLTNTSQLYFDTSSIGQPERLWRIVPVP